MRVVLRKPVPSLRIALVAFLLQLVPLSALAEVTIIPRNALPAFLFGRTVGQGLAEAASSALVAAQAKQDLSLEIARARERFWRAYPDGADLQEAEEEFASLLFAKDLVGLIFYLPEGPYARRAGIFQAITGGQVDGGIPQGARAAYFDWVVALREHMGARNHDDFPDMGRTPDLVIVTPLELIEALGDPQSIELYNIYKLRRDRHEFNQAGRLADFEALQASLRPTAPAAPEPREEWCSEAHCNFEYGIVAEDFHPSLDLAQAVADENGVGWVLFSMKKFNLGSLTSISLYRGPPGAYFLRGDTRDYNEIGVDLNRIRQEGYWLLQCSYQLESSIGFRFFFFNREPPEWLDPAALRARVREHPVAEMLEEGILRGRADRCPLTWEAAQHH